MRGTVYHKNWQNHEMGQKKSIFEIDTENTPCDKSNALYFITDQKSHTKMKTLRLFVSSGVENMVAKIFWGLKSYF